MKFTSSYISESIEILNKIDQKKIEEFVNELSKLKKRKGRIFFLGLGGSAANCSHAVNDFRKLCDIESYTPMDNIAEFSEITRQKPIRLNCNISPSVRFLH